MLMTATCMQDVGKEKEGTCMFMLLATMHCCKSACALIPMGVICRSDMKQLDFVFYELSRLVQKPNK